MNNTIQFNRLVKLLCVLSLTIIGCTNEKESNNSVPSKIKSGIYGESRRASDVSSTPSVTLRNITIRIHEITGTDTVLIDSIKTNDSGLYQKPLDSGSYTLCDVDGYCTRIDIQNKLHRCNWVFGINHFRWTCGKQFIDKQVRLIKKQEWEARIKKARLNPKNILNIRKPLNKEAREKKARAKEARRKKYEGLSEEEALELLGNEMLRKLKAPNIK